MAHISEQVFHRETLGFLFCNRGLGSLKDNCQHFHYTNSQHSLGEASRGCQPFWAHGYIYKQEKFSWALHTPQPNTHVYCLQRCIFKAYFHWETGLGFQAQGNPVGAHASNSCSIDTPRCFLLLIVSLF